MKFKYENQKLICLDVENLRRMFRMRNVKVTGTTFLALLGKSKYHSPAFALLKKITGFQTTIDPKYAHAGFQYEPILIEKLMKRESDIVNYQPIEAKSVQFDYFKEDKYFGGIPDLLVFKTNDRVEIVDIKTTGDKNLLIENDINKKSWAPFLSEEHAQKNSPDYVFQVLLYAYLAKKYKSMNVTQASLFAGFLREEDYPDCSNNEIKYKPVNENMTTRYLNWPYTEALHRKMNSYVMQATSIIEEFLETGEIDLPTSATGMNFAIEENKQLLQHMIKMDMIVK